MKVLKISVIFTFLISIISIYLYYHFYDINDKSMITDLSLAIFGSASLICLTSLLQYWLERRACLLNYWVKMHDFSIETAIYVSYIQQKQVGMDLINDKMQELTKTSYECFEARSKLNFFFKFGLSNFIYYNIDVPVRELYSIIHEIRILLLEIKSYEDEKQLKEVNQKLSELMIKAKECLDKHKELEKKIKVKYSIKDKKNKNQDKQSK